MRSTKWPKPLSHLTCLDSAQDILCMHHRACSKQILVKLLHTSSIHYPALPAYTHIHTAHTHTHMHAHTLTITRVHTHTHTHTHTHKHTHTHAQAHILTTTRVHTHTQAQAQAHILTITRVHTRAMTGWPAAARGQSCGGCGSCGLGGRACPQTRAPPAAGRAAASAGL